MRAITIRVNDITGVAGYIIPGDRIDMLLTRESTNSKKPETTLMLQNVQVLGIDQQASEDQQEPRVVRSLTLAVTPAQAQKTVLASAVGQLTMALRNRGDADPARATRVTLADLGIGEAFRPTSSGGIASVPATPRRRGYQVAVTRGLAVQRYTVKREEFEPLTPTQLAPSLNSSDVIAQPGGIPAPSAPADSENEPASAEEEAPVPLLPPDRVNF